MKKSIGIILIIAMFTALMGCSESRVQENAAADTSSGITQSSDPSATEKPDKNNQSASQKSDQTSSQEHASTVSPSQNIEALILSADEKKALLKHADIITEQLITKSFNSSALEKRVEAPTEMAINSFILTVPLIEDDNYMYKDYMRCTKDLYYEYPTGKVQQIAYELFGKDNWILEGGDTELDETKNAYVTGLEFGIGTSLLCKDVSSEVSPESFIVISKFHVVSDMAFDMEKPGDPSTKDYGEYQIIYDVMSENNRTFLRFVAMEQTQ